VIKVYGPYRRKDGRQIVIHYDGRHRRTQSYPRYLMEQELGRKLEPWEQVDHINNDPTDDRLDNFQILTPKEKKKKAAIANGLSAKWLYFECPVCDSGFILKESTYRANQGVQGKKGPYCSRSCAGKRFR
jgi:hypothetical protein